MKNNLIFSSAKPLANNQVIINMGDYSIFYSYESFIASYNHKTEELLLNKNMWDYSNTTRYYFKEFIEYHTNFRYDSKQKFIKLINSDEKIVVWGVEEDEKETDM